MSAARVRLALLAVIVMVFAACGGAGGPSSDPAASVKAAFDAAASGGLTKLDDFACAAQKGKIAEAFGGADGVDALTQAGVKLDDVMSAMSVKFDNVTTKETSRADTKATVHVTGNMTVTVDPAKFKPILKADDGRQRRARRRRDPRFRHEHDGQLDVQEHAARSGRPGRQRGREVAHLLVRTRR